jgi:hypothetical protein
MGGIAQEKTNLLEITRREVRKYVGNTPHARMYGLLDDQNGCYGVVIVPEDEAERPAYMAVLARVVGDMVIIEEDGTVDKPLVEALMVNGGIPREQIVLAYQGEPLPDQT